MEGDSDDEARTANMSGHQLLWTAGEPCRWKSHNMKSAKDSLQSGPPQCSRSVFMYDVLPKAATGP